MSQCPIIAQAMAATPFWMRDILLYDGLEVHPVRDVGKEMRAYDGISPEETRFEPCKAEEAELWSVFGHLKTGGLECFEDYATELEAQRFVVTLKRIYSHLRD